KATNVTLPVTYSWTGTGGTIACPTCASTKVTGLTTAGSPYTFIVNITDAHGCIASDTMVVQVSVIPVVSAAPDDTICPWTPTSFCGTVVIPGTPPDTFLWAPAFGLNDSLIPCPTATVGSTTTYI